MGISQNLWLKRLQKNVSKLRIILIIYTFIFNHILVIFIGGVCPERSCNYVNLCLAQILQRNDAYCTMGLQN